VSFEIRYALRRLRRSYASTAVMVVGMAIGIGSSAAVLAAARALLWSDVPYPAPGRLAMLEETGSNGTTTGISLQDFLDLRAGAPSVERAAAYRLRSFGWSPADSSARPAVIEVGLVTSDFFATLGIEPARGRSFTGEEELAEAGVIVLSHELARPLGATVLLNDEPRTVVGILPEGFRFPIARGYLPGAGAGIAPQAYIPISHRDYGGKRAVRSLAAIVRVNGSATLERARAELGAVASRLASSYPETNRGVGASVVPIRVALRSPNRRPLAFLGSGVLALVALVAFNLGGLLLAGLVGRGREVAIRLSLGARPRDVFAPVFAETLLATSAGAALGLVAARLALRSIPSLIELLGGFTSTRIVLGPEAPVVAFGMALATASAIAALVVRLGIGSNLESVLRSGSLTGRSLLETRRAVVVAQVALAVLLVQCAGLLGRSLVRLASVDPGFETGGALAFGIGLPEARYDSDEKMVRFHRGLETMLGSIPGVEAAGASAGAQLSRGIPLRIGFRFEGSPLEKLDWPRVSARLASPGYLGSLGLALIRGRDLTWSDGGDRPPVALVNRAFERAFLRDGNAIGKRIEIAWQKGALYEIVGVIGDVRQVDLRTEAEPEIVLSFARFPPEGAVYVVRTARRDPGLVDELRAAVDRIDGRLEEIRVRPLSSWVEESTARERLAAGLALVVSSTALGLAALGVYGILALAIVNRRREIALRLALGASPGAVRSLVASEAVRLALLGIGLGGAAFALLAPVLGSLAFELGPADVPTIVTTFGALLVALVAAAWAPVSKAVRTSPMDALRVD
jgi:putative ABC transport system permease protein